MYSKMIHKINTAVIKYSDICIRSRIPCDVHVVVLDTADTPRSGIVINFYP